METIRLLQDPLNGRHIVFKDCVNELNELLIHSSLVDACSSICRIAFADWLSLEGERIFPKRRGKLSQHRAVEMFGKPGFSNQDESTLHIPNNDGMVGLLVKTYPAAALSTRNNDGALPMHVLCGRRFAQPSLKVVECLIKPYPAALLTRTTSSEDLPITLACEEASLSVIYTLVRGYPEVVPYGSVQQ